jgi:hypothetical protein
MIILQSVWPQPKTGSRGLVQKSQVVKIAAKIKRIHLENTKLKVLAQLSSLFLYFVNSVVIAIRYVKATTQKSECLNRLNKKVKPWLNADESRLFLEVRYAN